ncbi:hypothetical protein MKW98_020920 [Papaver atlanticum]|uniref:aspartate--tRNA ligase n=1 Tax=Papaver atlanticum TaxID=357466 RepID=A0AAD4XVS7_9MAGN|nr:hypothetical protein MKW98_020920 [Papaver atlanticum]
MEADPLSENYGEVVIQDLQSKHISGRRLTEIRFFNETLKDKTVLIRGKIQTSRCVGKNSRFLVLKEKVSSIQCVLTVEDNLSPQMVKFATSLSKEFNVEIEGIVSVPDYPIKRATQNVELQVTKIYCFSEALPNKKKALQPAKQIPHVNPDKCLNFRVLDVCTPANQQMFRIQCQVDSEFMQYLLSEGFLGIDTPKVIATSQTDGPPACLAQSPQLHKQMAICWGFGSVFEIGSVFRAEKSKKLRYLCECIGLDLEMEIKEHYSDVMDVVEGLFVSMFDSLNEKCKKELEAIGNQYPFKPLKYLKKTPRLTFEEGVQMLKEDGVKVNPLRDLNKQLKRKLGKLVLEKYGTEFCILHRYPTAIRPFYTMPSHDNPTYSNSFDVFIRGEEIISGGQRVHDLELLITRAESCGINLKSIEAYIDAFRYGTPPLGGFGVGFEKVVMLFCGLNNIRETSLCSPNPQRITP